MPVRRCPAPRARNRTSSAGCRAASRSMERRPDSSAMTSELAWLPRPELRQEAQVVLEEQAQVIHAITQHRQAIDAHAEGITAVFLRVDAAGFQHVRMHHAAAGDLQPAGVLADAA